jgi:L-lactate dehydrogenase complex protein LldE
VKAHLFIPCLVEHLAPEIGEATLTVLKRAGVTPVYLPGQTCCGQPLYKTGHHRQAADLARHFIALFEEAECVVAPSGSCVAMVRTTYPQLLADDPQWRSRAERLAGRTFELTEFLVKKLGRLDLGASFPAKVAYHDSCQVGRALGNHDSGPALLSRVKGVSLVPLTRPDACCGFGGVFSVTHPDISEALVEEKISDALLAGAEVIVSAEVSCFLNLDGYLKKLGTTAKALHIAQVLAAGEDA